VKRLRAWRTFSSQNRPGYDHMRDVSYDKAPVCDADVDAALDELEQLRAENARVRDELGRLTPRVVICPHCQRPTKLTATGLIRYHGPHNRPCKGSSILPEVKADAVPQQPEREGGD
jgi:hypothetical protein